MRYLIDTSSLISMIENRWYERLAADERVSSLATITSVLEELERLSQGAGTKARSARAALVFTRQTLKTGPEPVVQSHVDDTLLETAATHEWGIVSQDHALITRAKERGIPTLTLTRSGTIGD